MQSNETDTIIRFSGAWWAYMIFKLGFLRALVNGIEDALAITGRFLLLVFLMYCGAKAGLLLVQPDSAFPGWLEAAMFLLQLAGLEGSIPGLARQADTLRACNEHEAANRMDGVIIGARTMTVLAIAEGAAHALQLDIHILQWASAILLVIRGIVITGFLIALARIESKAPRILSRDALEREQEEQAQNSEQACTITSLQEQLQATQQELARANQEHTSLQGVLVEAEARARLVDDLQAELQQALQERDSLTAQLANVEKQAQLTADLQAKTDLAHRSQAQLLSDLQAQLAQVTRKKQDLVAQVNRSQNEVSDLSAKLEKAEKQVSDLTSKLQEMTSQQTGQQEVKKRSQVRSKQVSDEVNRSQGAVLQFVPRPDGGRRKHDPREVRAWCEAHPDLSQAEQAAELGISDAANLRRLLRRAREMEEVTGQEEDHAVNDQ